MKNEIEATAKTLSKHKIKQFSQEKLLVEKDFSKSNFFDDIPVNLSNFKHSGYPNNQILHYFSVNFFSFKIAFDPSL